MELEADIDTRELTYNFLNRSMPIFPTSLMIVQLRECKLMKVEAPFHDEISSLAIVKLLYYDTYTMTLKVKFERNFAFLYVSNNPP